MPKALTRALFLSLLMPVSMSCASAQPRTSATSARTNAQPKASEPEIPADLRQEIARACAIGRELYVFDKVSALATDVLVAEVPDFASRGVGGYIPMQEGDASGQPTASFLVTFFTRTLPPRAAFEVRVTPDSKPKLEAFTPPKELPAPFVSLIRARQLAIASIEPSQPLNPVLLPGAAIGEEGIVVYLLAGTSKPAVAVLGKHFRAVVSDDGARLIRLTPLSNTELEVPTRGPAGEKPAALTVTHVVTDFPLETHVFQSLLNQLPIIVGTKRGFWRVDGDKIAFLGEQPPNETR